jgi:6-phosphofructokinase 1
VIREIVCGLSDMYGVTKILGIQVKYITSCHEVHIKYAINHSPTGVLQALYVLIFFFVSQGGYRGFYARNTITLTPKSVNDIHKRGGTILGSSRGGHDTVKIVDSIQDRGINQVNETK